MSNTTHPDDLLGITDAANLTGFSPNTLRAWRHQNRGPTSFIRNGRVVYRRDDLTRWLAHRDAATTRGEQL